MLTQNNIYLLTDDEIENIFGDLDLLEKRSFFIIEEEKGGYDTNRTQGISYFEDMLQVKAAYQSGKTIVVKNLANYNSAIRNLAGYYGRDVDVCMFVSPPNGSSFGWHTDEEDVHIHGVKGTKMFSLKIDGKTTFRLVRPQTCLHIPPGVEHKGHALSKLSIHLSFGTKVKDYPVIKKGLTKKDLGLI